MEKNDRKFDHKSFGQKVDQKLIKNFDQKIDQNLTIKLLVKKSTKNWSKILTKKLIKLLPKKLVKILTKKNWSKFWPKKLVKMLTKKVCKIPLHRLVIHPLRTEINNYLYAPYYFFCLFFLNFFIWRLDQSGVRNFFRQKIFRHPLTTCTVAQRRITLRRVSLVFLSMFLAEIARAQKPTQISETIIAHFDWKSDDNRCQHLTIIWRLNYGSNRPSFC